MTLTDTALSNGRLVLVSQPPTPHADPLGGLIALLEQLDLRTWDPRVDHGDRLRLVPCERVSA